MVAFDALKGVIGHAVMGKQGEEVGDSLDGLHQLSEQQVEEFLSNPEGSLTATVLGDATSRTVYGMPKLIGDNPRPSFEASITRDEHVKGTTRKAKIGIKIEWLSGSEDVLQTAILREPGKWQLSGRTIYDNKSLPVRRFHPFFSNSHLLQSQPTDQEHLAMTWIRDPLDRVVGSLNPDHTWQKVRHTPWSAEIYGTGDNVLVEDPSQDADVGFGFKALEKESYLPTWYQTMSGSQNQSDRSAAEKSKLYNGTPSITYTDALGNAILSIQDNGSQGKYAARLTFDCMSNPIKVENASGSVIAKVMFDMSGKEIYRIDADSGERWGLYDCLGRAILTLDSAGLGKRTKYDPIGRVEEEWIQQGPSSPELLVAKTIFGEAAQNAAANNLRTQTYQIHDQAGVSTNLEFDFEGRLIQSQVQLAKEYKAIVDWSKTGAEEPALESEVFKTQSEYNALSHAVRSVATDGSATTRTYDVAGNLQTVQFQKESQTSNPIEYITSIIYTVDGKPEQITYGNGVVSKDSYDDTMRLLRRSQVLRPGRSTGVVLKDMEYSYDCEGRVVFTYDNAAQDIYFNDTVVKAIQDFRYDAVGQLIEAHGREQFDASEGKRTLKPSNPSDYSSQLTANGNQICEYIERYQYDAIGNIQSLQHGPATDSTISGWTRNYFYEEPNIIDPGNSIKSDRLSRTTVGDKTDAYGYDGLGHMTSSSTYYSSLSWDFNGRLHSSSMQVVNDGTPETTYYVYNAGGKRVRKVVERAATRGGASTPTRSKERLYLPDTQIYRTYAGDGATISLQTKEQLILQTPGDGASSAVAILETHSSSPNSTLVRYQTTNNLELDDEANVISYSEYSPFGVSMFALIRSGVEAPRRYRFARYERDKETGMYHCGERYYAPWLGRWTSADPIGLGDGVNRYCYVRNDPTNFSDIHGTCRRGGGNANRGGGNANRFQPYNAVRQTPQGLQKVPREDYNKYVGEQVESAENVMREFSNSATFKSLADARTNKTPISLGLSGMEGCSSLILTSDTGVYMTHWWENLSYWNDIPDATAPNGTREATALEQNDIFQAEVLDRLSSLEVEIGPTAGPSHSVEDTPALRNQRHPTLIKHRASFKKDSNVRAFLMTPYKEKMRRNRERRALEQANREARRNGQPETQWDPLNDLRYGDRVQPVRQQISNILGYNLEDNQWKVQGYEKEGAGGLGINDVAYHKALFEFDPRGGGNQQRAGARPSRSAANQTYQKRVWIEGNMLLQE